MLNCQSSFSQVVRTKEGAVTVPVMVILQKVLCFEKITEIKNDQAAEAT